MDDSHYDEFGNYIGPELQGDDDDDELEEGLQAEEEDAWMEEAEARADGRLLEPAERAGGPGPGTIVLAEDKKYYPTAEEVYGKDTETLVQDEDAQALEVPIVAPVRAKRMDARDRGGAAAAAAGMVASPAFLEGLLAVPGLVRNVAVAGHLHHGKTSLLDMLVEQTHAVKADPARDGEPSAQRRFTDTRQDEQERRVSIKASAMSLALAGSAGKSYAVNLMDAPGHPNFSDELSVALRLADGVLIVVDAAEGALVGTERAIKAAVAERLPIVLLINKVDRLITELKLPPADAYVKLRHTVEEVNTHLAAAAGGAPGYPPLDPASGNVCFASALYGWSFTLASFARMYLDAHGGSSSASPTDLASRLWGDVWYHRDQRAFRRRPAAGGERTFVEFVLSPLYKLHSRVVGEQAAEIAAALAEFGVVLKPSQYAMNVRPLLKLAMTKVMGPATGLVDMLATWVPSAEAAAAAKVDGAYTGPRDSALCGAMAACTASGPCVVHIAKLVPKDDCTAFDAFGRVMAGVLRVGDVVKVLGEGYSPEDEEDCVTKTVTAIWIWQARYRLPVTVAHAGSWALIEGVDASIAKTATLVPEGMAADAYIFKPLRFDTLSVVKIATEPLNPSDLPKMVEGLRKINKSYPLAVTKVEESGEHTILGTGELYMDSIMRDLRDMFSDVEVKVADPIVSFCETVVETSSLKCFAETPNKKNKLTMIAEPLDKGLAEDIERGAVRADWPKKKAGDFFQSRYEWDVLAARSVWAFGPDSQGPNALLDDTLPSEVDKGLLAAVRASVVQGFQWGAREGPLCDEPMRNVKFKVLDASIAPDPLHRGGGQMIPTARRVCYSSFLMATPRLMEPIYLVEIQTPADAMSAIYTVLSKRRGHVIADSPRPGTPIYIVRALLPVVESFGFETDLRYHTQGQAFCLSVFDHWAVVPGDPLDKSVVLRPLEPAPAQCLAREFMVKTRRRKGMSDDVSVSNFFESTMLAELAKMDLGF